MPSANERRRRKDLQMLNAAIRQHRGYAVGRLRVQAGWARQDEADEARAGDRTRAAMKRAQAERLDRVIDMLERSGRGGADPADALRRRLQNAPATIAGAPVVDDDGAPIAALGELL